MRKQDIMPKVTVIMPSLNVARYIEGCMRSVLEQSLNEIEVLAIDAGSDDGTLEMIQEFARKDDRVKVILSDKRSYGYQVNLGMEHATGEYIGIVETDDKIALDMYERLYQIADKTKADYVKGRAEYYVDLSNGESWSTPIALPLQEEHLLGQVIDPSKKADLLLNDIFLWSGIYRKEFIRKIRLNETPGAAFQDQGFLLQTMSQATSAVYIDHIVYRYRQDNINSSIFNPKGFHYLVEEYALNQKYLQAKEENWTRAFYQRMLNQAIGRFQIMALSSYFWENARGDMDQLRCQLQEAADKQILTQDNLGEERWELLQVWFEDPKEVYHKYREMVKDHVSNIQTIVRRTEGQPIVIFGSGILGKFVNILLQHKSSGTVKAFADNNEVLWNCKVQGVKILSPKEAVKQYPDAVYIISNAKYGDEIQEQLREMGIDEKQTAMYMGGIHLSLLQVPIEKRTNKDK
ncbi:putative capsular polysaccharide biosynthesis protein,glycosyl transferase family 2, YveT [Lachnospiraceae bacterium KM106-2]|nr:putative capsular polysaccharide biosynthesis protein,glycosyl transferase family 2, YveT [Lachnospiraceae bacterium KM106-2]